MADEATVSVANALRGIENALRDVERISLHTADGLGQLTNEHMALKGTVQTLVRDFDAFVLADKRAKNIQIAETRIVKVRQRLDTNFGHYEEVRRRATGILQAVDKQLVTDDVIQHTTEDVMMNAPRYWLAPCLVLIAAWMREDRKVVKRAEREAIARDPSKSALFLSLLMRRYDRDVSVTWLERFLSEQSAYELRREFVVILDAVASGAFGPPGVHAVAQTTEDWLNDFKSRPENSETQVEQWREQLSGFALDDIEGSYPRLVEFSSDWSKMKASLQRVSSHRRIRGHFEEIFAQELNLPKDLEDRVDNLLTSLVSNFDVEELPLRREEMHLQAMIESDGDEDEANERAKLIDEALEEELDFPTLLTNAAMHPKESGASLGTQRLATALSKEWIVSAQQRWTAYIRHNAVIGVSFDIDGWTGTFEAGNEEQLTRSLTANFAARRETALAEASDQTKLYGAAGAGAVLVILGLATQAWFFVVIGLLAFGYAGYEYVQINQRREKVNSDWQMRQAAAERNLRDVIAEVIDYRRNWAKEDAEAGPALNVIRDIEPANFNLAIELETL